MKQEYTEAVGRRVFCRREDRCSVRARGLEGKHLRKIDEEGGSETDVQWGHSNCFYMTIKCVMESKREESSIDHSEGLHVAQCEIQVCLGS